MENSNRKVVVLGAGGLLGKAVTRAFAGSGWQVRAQLRAPRRSNSDEWHATVEPWYCDALDGKALLQAVEGARVVVNALNPRYTDWETQAREMCRNAIAAARASSALLMFPGNIYNFGRELPASLYETTPAQGNTSKAKIRIEMEADLQAAAAEGLDCVIMRAGDYLSPAPSYSWFDEVIVKSLARDIVVYPGATDQLHAWCYLPDFAEAFVRVASHQEQLHGFNRFQFPGYTITGSELHTLLEQAVGRSLKFKKMSWWPMRLAAPFSPMMRALLEMSYLWEKPHRLRDGALGELIGELPETPLPAAMQAIGVGHGWIKPL